MSARWLVVLALAGCAVVEEPDPLEPCLEAGYAIAYVSEVCSGDAEVGNDRYHRFEKDFRCVPRAWDDPELEAAGIQVEDLYGCAFAIRQLTCETVDEYGNDIGAYLDVSNACGWITTPAGGGR